MPSKESLAVAQKYNQSVNICFCRTVPQESEKCYNCRSLADLLDEAIRAEAEWWSENMEHDEIFQNEDEPCECEGCKRLAQLREGKAQETTNWDLLLNSEWPFYGATENQFKIGGMIWEVLEDECDGYRSSLGTIERKVSDAIFFKRPLARVKIIDARQITGWELVDAKDGHVWLEFGTDESDSYYPSFIFHYQPKGRR